MTAGFRVVANSHTGLIRTGNEDAGMASTRLLAVADGMGGHAAGEVAAATVIRSLLAAADEVPTSVPEVENWLLRMVDEAHGLVGDLVAADPEKRGMGTTLTALVACEDRAVLGHVGDSRAYRLRGEHIEQLSTDHTYVQMLVDSGELSPAAAETHPRRNLLMRTIDGIHDVTMDISTVDLQFGDRFLLCSDGLSGVIGIDVLAERLREADLTKAVANLIEFALAAGAPDNVTVVVAEYLEDVPTISAFPVGCAAATDVSTEPVESTTRPSWLWLGVAAAALLAVGMGFYGWLQQQWFVGVHDGVVAIYHGIPQEIGPINFASLESETELAVSSLTPLDQTNAAEGITTESLAAAEAMVAEMRLRALELCEPGCTG